MPPSLGSVSDYKAMLRKSYPDVELRELTDSLGVKSHFIYSEKAGGPIGVASKTISEAWAKAGNAHFNKRFPPENNSRSFQKGWRR